ncbi:fimbrial biogenesis chaperone [Caenimonas soli]|uniref:fimbrial biogenesis chaperone n=1 Tax=Caenimonas soli TaxID=2735555 RepID=UPI001553F1B4|nr:fimbria/pilus periplasmic chaperone [Caenimonas soli]NPC58064.1 molecular chaperone [Caenimonas soli]
MWCALLLAGAALAGEFTVNPTRLDLGAAARSGAVTVRNEGKLPLSFQLQAMEWAQDATGKDQYTEARDLIFFPKILTVEPGQEGVVRVGTRTPVVPAEKTYRLFIEELPGTQKDPEKPGVQITFLIRFGAPVFIAPVQPQDGLEIESVELANGELNLSARNTGNRHQIIKGIHLKGSDAAGKEVYSATLADRYLLAGAVKPFKTAIAGDQCVKIAALEVEIKTDRLNATRKLEVTRAMCAPK